MHSACGPCWKTYINEFVNSYKGLIQDSNVNPLGCMFCDVLLSFEFIESMTSKACFSKYLDFYVDLKVIKSKKYVYCPKKDCEKVLVTSSQSMEYRCECGYILCGRCLSKSHFPISCAQYVSLKNTFKPLFEINTSTSLATSGKSCPKCRRFIEKNGEKKLHISHRDLS